MSESGGQAKERERGKSVAAVIPCYNPGEALIDLADRLRGIFDIVLVNDGSAAEAARVFSICAQMGAHVINHETNLGKGRALKTGFAFVEGLSCETVITIDCDGQHSPSDAFKIAENTRKTNVVTFGVRDFASGNVPQKSKTGHFLITALLKMLFHINISDSQTGLRAYPAYLLPFLTAVPGERYEYETNALLALAKKNFAIAEIPIQTIYRGENGASFYRPFADSMRVLGCVLKGLLPK